MKQTNELYIGLMSGTSLDGIDVALINLKTDQCQLISHYFHPLNQSIKERLILLSSPTNKNNSPLESNIKRNQSKRIELLAELDVIMANQFAEAANKLLQQNQLTAKDIIAVGSHGQTVRHRPNNHFPFSIQIGDANIIAEKTGITTVADFRRADLAAGGQGAPLAPAFHNAILRSNKEDRIVLNLGGIANVTFLPKNKKADVIGFDTGPANTLLDAYYIKNHNNREYDFDKNAEFAQQGINNQALLNLLINDPYFQMDFPKSTGREYFSLNWLEQKILQINKPINHEDIQATLLQLTVLSIAESIQKLNLENYSIFACGGGMHNHYLLTQLSQKINHPIQTTNDLNVDGDYLEAMTFAWLAKQRLQGLPGNIPSVTGASKRKVLGGVYLP